MCPFCLSTIGLLVAGAVSSGGLTALAVKLPRKKGKAKEVTPNVKERNSQVQKTSRVK